MGRRDQPAAERRTQEVSDIVERLRAWVYTDSLYATAREAADEIERLRQVVARENMTDAEREAVEVAAAAYAEDHGESFAATLRSLLARQNPPSTDRP